MMADEITKEIDPIQAEPVEAEPITDAVTIPDPVPTSEPIVAPIITEQPEPIVTPAEETPLIPLSGEAEPAQAPIIVPTPTPIVTAPTPEPSPTSAPSSGEAKPVVSEPVVFSPPAKGEQRGSVEEENTVPLSKMDKILASFKDNMLHAKEFLLKAHAAVSAKRRKKIDSVMTLFLKKKKIVNSDVRDFLHIAEDTATNYLNILLKEGKIKRNGRSTGIYYTKV